jgi:hypothetical protein
MIKKRIFKKRGNNYMEREKRGWIKKQKERKSI